MGSGWQHTGAVCSFVRASGWVWTVCPMRLVPVPCSAVLHPDDVAQGWQLWGDTDSQVQVAVTTDVALLNDPATSVECVDTSFRRPQLSAAQLQRFLDLRMAGRRFSDDAKVRLVGLPSQVGDPVVVGEASYLDQHLTNELGACRLYDQDMLLVDGPRLWSDSSGRMLPVGRTGCADTLGGGVLAVTADRWVVAGRRAADSAVLAGMLDLSCSGSFDRPTCFPPSFAAFAHGELRRELSEETGVPDDAEVELRIVAVVRSLQRGGLPDLLAAARLPVSLSQLSAQDDLADLVPLGQVSDVGQFGGLLAEVVGGHSGVTPNLRLFAALLGGQVDGSDGGVSSQITGLFG